MLSKILRSTLVALVAVTLLAGPASAAAPARDEAPRAGWTVDLRESVTAAWGWLIGVWGSEMGGEKNSGGQGEGEVRQFSAADTSNQGSGLDPNG